MRSSHCFERKCNRSVEVESFLVHKVVEPIACKQKLDFAEDRLDGVELRTVAYIENRVDVQILHQLSNLLCFVHGQLVQEKCKGSFFSFSP